MKGKGEIAADLGGRIERGEVGYQPGDRLPTVRELMAQYGTASRDTIDRALRTLETAGLVTVIHGSGSYVRTRHVVRRDLVAGLLREHAYAVGDAPEGSLVGALTGQADVTVTTVYQWTGADAPAARALEVEPGGAVLVRRFVFRVGDEVHQIARSVLPAELARRAELMGPQSERVDAGTIALLVGIGVRVQRAVLGLSSRMPTGEERATLRILPGTPVFAHSRVLWAEGRPVEHSTSVVPADRAEYEQVVTFDQG